MGVYEIRTFETLDDPRAHETMRQAGHLGADVDVTTNRVFYVEGISEDEAIRLAQGLLSDPVSQRVEVGPRNDWDNDNRVEVAPLPGVANPEKGSIKFGAQLLGIAPTEVESGVEYHFAPGTPADTRERVVHEVLMNTKVEQVRRERPDSLVISGSVGKIEKLPIRDLDDDGLVALSKKHKTALNLDEMRKLQAEARKMGREMTDGELRYMGGRWSDHCCHKTTNADIITKDGIKPSIFSRIKSNSTPYFEAREVLSAYGDNSGVFRFYKGKAINIKLETHNSPRDLDPRGGAATGTGGVLRDINETGKGAEVISSMHMDFVAPPDMPDDQVPAGRLHPRQLLTGSVKGVGGYGNPMGVPTNNGSFHVHESYRGRGSILVGSMGIMEEDRTQQGAPEPGDLVLAVGGRTGRDGIGGATFSSVKADGSTATTHAGAVQIGDPIAEKKMFNAIMEASDKGLIRAMTDCGAAGFASAIGELGEDIGVQIDLSEAPLKYTGLQPWEIWISESQERAVLAIDPRHADEIADIFAKHGSEATVLGSFGTPETEPRLQVTYNGESLIDLDYEFIKHGLGTLALEAEWTPADIPEVLPVAAGWEEAVTAVLSDWNVCSKESIVRRYDQEVQGMSAMKSYDGIHGDGPNNAAVMVPIFGEPYALVQAHGCNPTLTELDPHRGSIWSYVEGMSNFVAAGGNPDDAVLVNNYISALPTPRVMGALDMSVDALGSCVREFESPIISGKDSLSSTFELPDGTLLESPYNLIITVAGKIPNVEKTISTDIKQPGSTLILIGKQDLDSMGGSVYYNQFNGSSNHVPDIDIQSFHKTSSQLYAAIQTGQVLSTHDVSEGGVAVTIAEMLFGGDCGAELELEANGYSPEQTLFNETAGCFVVEVADADVAAELFGGIPHTVIGRTTAEKQLRIIHGGNALPVLDILQLKQAWKGPLEEVLAT